MKKELANIFGSVYLTIEVDKKNKWLHNDWKGYLTMENVKTGAMTYIETIKGSGLDCVLNDNSKVLGSWDHSIEWVKDTWEPLAANAGIRHFAMIVSQNSLTESSAKSFEALIKSFEVKVFYNIPEAEAWLRLRSSQAGLS